MKVHYPKLYNMVHFFSLNVFTASKGPNKYIIFFSKSTTLNKRTMTMNSPKSTQTLLSSNYLNQLYSHRSRITYAITIIVNRNEINVPPHLQG